jgi:hypothetical protein
MVSLFPSARHADATNPKLTNKMKNNTEKTTVQIFQSRDGWWFTADENGKPLDYYDYQMRETLDQAMRCARKCGMTPKRNERFDRSF